MNLRTLFNPIRKPVPSRSQAIMRLADWMRDKELVGSSRKMMITPMFQAMLAILMDESPHNTHLLGVDMNERALHQARIEGYNLCMNNLQSFGRLDEMGGQIEATFQPPEPIEP